jgi:hypothetical protein
MITQAQLDSMTWDLDQLNTLRDERVVRVEPSNDHKGVDFVEQCDRNFAVAMSTQKIRLLAEELILLADRLERAALKEAGRCQSC